MVARQRAFLGVAGHQRVVELVVPRPLLQLPQGDGEVVQVEAPAAVVEVDRPHRTSVEQEVLVVEIAVDQAEPARLLRQLPRRRPDHLERPSEQRRVIGKDQRLDEPHCPIAVLPGRVIAEAGDRGRPRHRVDLAGLGQRVDPWPQEPGRAASSGRRARAGVPRGRRLALAARA